MPDLKTIRTALSTLPSGPPVVVAVTGGTSGIGSYIVRTLARTFSSQGPKLRVYIVGRRASSAETLITFAQQTCPGSDFRFIQASDLALLSDVARVSEEIRACEHANPWAGGPPRLDALYMTQALSPLAPSNPTHEGIDAQMSLLYYSRLSFIQHLTPLLLAPSSPSHVISVFAGSMEEKIAPGTLPIGTPAPGAYNINTVRGHVAFMKTLAFEHLATQHAGKISFCHIYPGLVDGPTFTSDVNPLWFRVLWRGVKPLMRWYMTPPETCGEVMVYLATGRYAAKGEAKEGDVAFSTLRERGGGAYGVGQRGDERKDVSYVKTRKGGEEEKVWEHTAGVIRGAEEKGA